MQTVNYGLYDTSTIYLVMVSYTSTPIDKQISPVNTGVYLLFIGLYE